VINDMIVEAPADSFNQLLLNYAGTNVPLIVNGYLTLGANASLVSYYSALNATDLLLLSPALFAQSSVLKSDAIDDYANLTLSNSFASAREFYLGQNSAVAQVGGISQFDTIDMQVNSQLSLTDGGLQANYVLVNNQPYGEFISGTSTVVLAGGSMVINSIVLGDPVYGIMGDFLLQDGNLVCSNYEFWNGNFQQSGGTNTIGALSLPAGVTYYSQSHYQASYTLSAGTLVTGNVLLGQWFLPEEDFFSIYPGYLVQSGGIHTNVTVVVEGFLNHPYPGSSQFPDSAGSVSLSGGLLVSSNETVLGAFTQTGGTNQVQLLSIYYGGSYSLATGVLAAAQTLIVGYQRNEDSCAPATIFVQQSGMHSVVNSLTIDEFATYELDAGTLAAQDILVDPTSQLFCKSGSVSNWGTFTLEGGSFVPGTQSHSLGRLQLWAATNVFICGNTGTVTLDLSGPSGTALRFCDSRDAVWSAPGLQLLGWQPWGGGGRSHHVFFGTNSQGLTPAQLSKLAFVNPSGWPPGNYPAQILVTGEVVPAVPPPLIIARSSNALVLSWAGDYQLLTATNVSGPYSAVPGAVSPVTNPFTAPQKYFRLGLPGP